MTNLIIIIIVVVMVVSFVRTAINEKRHRDEVMKEIEIEGRTQARVQEELKKRGIDK